MKTLATRRLHWLAWNAVFSACVVAWLVFGIEPAGNVARYAIWFFGVCSAIALTDDFRKEAIARGRTMPAWVDGLVDGGIIVLLLWHGHEVLAAVWTFHVLAVSAAFIEPKP